MPGGAELDLLAPYPMGSDSSRLWLAQFHSDLGLHDYLDRWGRPIRYRYVDHGYPMSVYQTVFSTIPGSAEMPSAGRPFSERVLASLVAAGVVMAPVTLHTGVSSLESNEPPYPEWAAVPTSTADLVNDAKARSARVIAVGTTVVRALESAVDLRGVVHPFRGWTDLLISPGHPIGAVNGLITGWHQSASSHLSMLEAVAGSRLLAQAYESALADGYLWHEFGDSLLLLPGRP